jgi:hypothetical protein
LIVEGPKFTHPAVKNEQHVIDKKHLNNQLILINFFFICLFTSIGELTYVPYLIKSIIKALFCYFKISNEMGKTYI